MDGGWGGSFDQLEQYLGILTSHNAITPYLIFGGRCQEAITFYESVLDAKVEMVMLFKDSPEPTPPDMLQAGFENKVMHASFVIHGTRIMASDGCDDKTPISGFLLSLSLLMGEIDVIFAKLSEGGDVRMPLAKTFWSPRFGMLTDKFGVQWMLIVPDELA
ncbi:MAG: VOC family protein [Alphaproteobacteria bacterium]|nr:VOC family protein [Alphaproteobacteria bacterium]